MTLKFMLSATALLLLCSLSVIAQNQGDSVSRNITFLNAANFDFTDNISGSYLGKINIFAPTISKRVGFNAGVMRIKYNYKDSSNAPLVFQNILLHPLDTIKQGTKYVREYNKFTSTRSNTVWSFYIQPMYRIASNQAGSSQIYIHFHGELLVSKVNITTNIENIQRDTVAMSASFREPFVLYQKTPIIFDKTYLNGYFGIGLTFSLDPFRLKNSRFFFQPTVGVTTNYPNWTSQDIYASNDTIIAPNTVIPTRGGLAYRKEPFPPTTTTRALPSLSPPAGRLPMYIQNTFLVSPSPWVSSSRRATR